VTLGVATGAERYTMLNGREQTLKAGDMLMADGEGIISSVLYGPDQRTRITPGTRDVLFAVYAPAGIGEAAVRQHLTDIQESVLLIAPDARTELLAVYPAR
jgi:DNA/RNA-binding domain of Phe-tRNA-synthetase-like protein